MKHIRLSQLVAFLMVTLSFVAQLCGEPLLKKTPADAEGPFYPRERQLDEDNDLLNIKGKNGSASGDILNLQGIVVNENGQPLSEVIIEIWQTDTNGLYRHPRDRSPGARDPFFQYWGRARTDKEGRYRFITLVPGEYEPRPAHIHFKVWLGGKVVLTSQMYIVKDTNESPRVNEQLKLKLEKNNRGQYSGFFQIVY